MAQRLCGRGSRPWAILRPNIPLLVIENRDDFMNAAGRLALVETNVTRFVPPPGMTVEQALDAYEKFGSKTVRSKPVAETVQ